LLYPIKVKNYQQTDYVKTEWITLQDALKVAKIVTIFGYGAPKTDVEAMRIIKQGWGKPNDRRMEQVEIIDVKTESQLLRTWKPLIHSHHYEVHSTYFDSWVARHPRHSVEAYWKQYFEGVFLTDKPFPTGATELGELWRWCDRLEQDKSYERPDLG
jgi:hypothetical protein